MFKSELPNWRYMHPAERLRSSGSNDLFAEKHILLCVTGSIAAVETVRLVREFTRRGADVTATMTESATEIIHPDALWFASGKPVITELDGSVQHVTLADSGMGGADIFVVAPCSANTISKLACGICDDAVSTILVTALGTGKPIVIAPAMHKHMWGNPMIGDNIEAIITAGVEVVIPLFSENKAKMASIDNIVHSTARRLYGSGLSGRKVTVIGGSTYEPIDSVRAVTNYSTGGTAVSLAREAYIRGAEVELIMGRSSVPFPEFIQVHRFDTAADLGAIISAKEFDILLMPAAVSDFTPSKKIDGKLDSSLDTISIELKRNKKLVDQAKAKLKIGFKLEVGIDMGELRQRATSKLKESGMTAIVANRMEDVRDDLSKALLIDRDGKELELEGGRDEIARSIMKYIAERS